MRPAAALLCLALCSLPGGCGTQGYGRNGAYRPQEGDVVFQSLPHGELIDAIEGATGSPYSHCGLVRSTALGWTVVEAVQPVCETPLENWITQARDDVVHVYRLRQADANLRKALVKEAQSFLGLPYDLRFRLDDEKIYCSELIYKAHQKATGKPLGQTCRLGDLPWQPFRDLITRIEKGPVPEDREMITPKALSEAPELEFIGTF